MTWVMNWPRLVLGLAFASALASIILASARLDIHTDQLELISPDHPLIALTERLEPFSFGGKTTFTVVIEAPTPDSAVSFVKALGARIKQDPAHFREALYQVDPNRIKRWALLYLGEKEILDVRNALDEHSTLIHELADSPTLLTFLKLTNQEMASRMVGELFTGFLSEEGTTEGAETKKGKEEGPIDLSFLSMTLDGINCYLQGYPEYKSPWASFFDGATQNLDLESYFWEGGKRFLLMTVLPREKGDGFNKAEDSLEQLRKLIREVQTFFPGVQAGVTGQEALNNDEMTTVMGDMTHATWLSFLGVLLLMVFFFRGMRRPLIEIISLMIGVCWTFGFTTLVVGHLNILSIVFGPLLCGLGVDYGIHWFARFEEEELAVHGDRRAAIHRVTERSGPGILLAGVSAAFSFLPLVLTGFRGLMELGLITGTGILLILVSNFSVLPALSMYAAGRPRKQPSPEAAPEDRDLLRLTPRTACLILTLAVVLCVWGIKSATQVTFDLNPLRLQAVNAESVVWETRLIENSQRSLLAAAVLASSPEEVITRTKEIEKLPSVSEVVSALSILPEHQEEKIPLVRTLVPKIPIIRSEDRSISPSDMKTLADLLERIRFKMQEDQAGQWGADKPTIDQMGRVRSLAGEIVRFMQENPGDAAKALVAYQRRFREDLTNTWDFLRQGAEATPMTVLDIPKSMRDSFYHDGQYLIRIFPKESILDQGALTRFVTDLQGVDPKVAGDPISLYVFAATFKKACIDASIYALIAIFILLMGTFRSIFLTLLTLVPLAVGTLLTIGLMGLVGVNFNLANSMFMPLILGAGVEYAVIIVHRWREGRMEPGRLPRSTGKGVILAALTTTVGFGTLMISHHRGIFSLGFVAWAGSLCVLVAALVFLPAILIDAIAPRAVSGKEVLSR